VKNYFFLTLLLCSCGVRSEEPNFDKSWIGVYVSTGEIADFSGTVLGLGSGLNGDPSYRKRFYSDVVLANAVGQEESTGYALIEEERIYIPKASGYKDGNDIRLSATVERWHRLTINKHQVLMRDDAFKAYTDEKKLYDYGILVKVSDSMKWDTDLSKVQTVSIKLLYEDPKADWKDPFVNGPNPSK
jgi:hypothetical protein